MKENKQEYLFLNIKYVVHQKERKKRFLELIKLYEERDVQLCSNKQYISAAKLCRVLSSEGYKVGESTIRVSIDI